MTISLTDFKKLLGPLTEQLTPEDIEWLRDAEYKLADAIFERWLRKQNARSRGVIDHGLETRNNEST
jgi:hypothetical protein